MLEFVCSIPDNIGWMMVGAVGMLCLVMMYNLGKIGVEMWRDRHEDDEEAEETVDI